MFSLELTERVLLDPRGLPPGLGFKEYFGKYIVFCCCCNDKVSYHVPWKTFKLVNLGLTKFWPFLNKCCKNKNTNDNCEFHRATKYLNFCLCQNIKIIKICVLIIKKDNSFFRPIKTLAFIQLFSYGSTQLCFKTLAVHTTSQPVDVFFFFFIKIRWLHDH